MNHARSQSNPNQPEPKNAPIHPGMLADERAAHKVKGRFMRMKGKKGEMINGSVGLSVGWWGG